MRRPMGFVGEKEVEAALRQREVEALENIARDLDRIAGMLEMAGEWAAAITTVDDKGQKGVHIVGEFVGGDGDVTAGL